MVISINDRNNDDGFTEIFTYSFGKEEFAEERSPSSARGWCARSPATFLRERPERGVSDDDQGDADRNHDRRDEPGHHCQPLWNKIIPLVPLCFGVGDFTPPALAVFPCPFQCAERPLQIWADVVIDRRGRLFVGRRRLPFESLISPLDQVDGRSRCPRP